MLALERYDESKPLENFLSVHIRNRIINFNRDKFIRKRKLYETERLDLADEDDLSYRDSELDSIEDNEVWDKIDRELPRELREDYLKVLDGVSIPTKNKRRLMAKLQELLCQKSEE